MVAVELSFLALTKEEKIQNVSDKKISSLFYYDVIIIELELDLAQFVCGRGA